MQTIARGEEVVFIILPISHQQDYEVSNHPALCKASRPSENSTPSRHLDGCEMLRTRTPRPRGREGPQLRSPESQRSGGPCQDFKRIA